MTEADSKRCPDEQDSEFVCGNCGAGIPDSHIGPNPTDAQVEAAIQAWMANDEEYGDVAMRAALRAAYAVTDWGEETNV